MTLLTVVQDVCAVVGVAIPTSVFSGLSTNRTMQEMVALANEMALRVIDARDWSETIDMQTYTGDGVKEDFDLPINFKRLLKNGNVWRSTSALQPMQYISNLDEWAQRRALNRYSPWGEYTIYWDQIHIWPIMGAGVTANFTYVTNLNILLSSGGYGTAFLHDGDIFTLNERLLKLGMIWQWKANKGAAYNEDLNTYNDALDRTDKKPAPIYIGRTPISAAAKTAYPFQVPT